MSREEVGKLFALLDTDSSNSIEEHELREVFMARNFASIDNSFSLDGFTGGYDGAGKSTAKPDLAAVREQPSKPMKYGQTIDEMRPLAGQLSDLLIGNAKGIIDAFRDWDADHSDTISYGEFVQAMSAVGIKNSRKLTALWREFDKDGSETLSYDELLEALAPPRLEVSPTAYSSEQLSREKVASSMRVSVTGLVRSASEQLHQAFEEIATDRIQDVFRAWDVDGGGTISRAEFGKAMVALGVKATKTEMNKLFNELDPDNSGAIDFKEIHNSIVSQSLSRASPTRSSPSRKPIARISPQSSTSSP